MRLVTYCSEGHRKVGALLGDRVVDLIASHRALKGSGGALFPESMIALLEAGDTGLQWASSASAFAETHPAGLVQPLAQVTLLPPVTRPGKVIALGRNYAAHAAEGGADLPEFPMLFHKTATSLLGAGGTIIIPPVTSKADFEGELAVIIGRTCKQVSPEEALAYVAGYSIANDVSARDLQRRTGQFTAGKMLDTFGPLGPSLVTRDEVPDPGNLIIKTRLNDRVMQDSRTNDMIFAVPYTISYISQIATLEVGDVIFTGTPEGVGYARTPPVFLQNGDVVSVEIGGLGVLTNVVRCQGQ